MNWGGRRVGSGRKSVALSALVEAGSFSATNTRHRRALLEQPLKLAAGDGRRVGLLEAQRRFRVASKAGVRAQTAFWSRRFEELAREGRK